MEIISGLISLIKGLLVTLINFIRPPITVQYPDKTREISKIWRGTPRINEKCIVCELCSRICPSKCIKISSHTEEIIEGEKKSRKKKIDEFIIEIEKCSFCGLCQEFCPVQCIHFEPVFVKPVYKRSELIWNKEKLLKEKIC
jgi:formate hydrogenlyase subunit 6/NADH:ubiquinone oxidoreductase subunit I